MTDFLRGRGVVPAGFEVEVPALPLVSAALAGVLVTQLAIAATARRAGRTRAIEALREAAVERRPVTRGELVTGLAVLGAAALLMVPAVVQGGQTGSGSAFLVGLLLMVAAALLGPLAVQPLASWLGRPLERAARATGSSASCGEPAARPERLAVSGAGRRAGAGLAGAADPR